MHSIQLESISKSFDKINALQDINLVVSEGETIGLFGHNGAGKTTLIKIILGVIQPTSGIINVFNTSTSSPSFKHLKKSFGYLPENVNLYNNLTGVEILDFYAKLKQAPRSKCLELLEEVGLKDFSNRKVKHYSNGMRQRLGLAQALLSTPRLLLLDEPTVGLDPIATQNFYDLIGKIKKSGCTIILCTHTLSQVEQYIDKAAFLSGGNLLAYDSLDLLLNHAELPTRIIFKSDKTINLSATHPNAEIIITGEKTYTLKTFDKISSLKSVLTQNNITDLIIQQPNLEDLYLFYNGKSLEDAKKETTISKFESEAVV